MHKNSEYGVLPNFILASSGKSKKEKSDFAALWQPHQTTKPNNSTNSNMPPKKAAKGEKGSDVFADKVFAISGSLTQTKAVITSLLEEHGGSVASSVTKKVCRNKTLLEERYLQASQVTHLITTAEDFADAPSKVETAKVFFVA
jgi:hypothetical protein